MVKNQGIHATGFEHWVLGTANLAEPIVMPTHLPYAFSTPDSQGRVPFPDVSLASRYQWATDPQNGHRFHDNVGTVYERLSDETAVARCMLQPYMYAAYGSQRFVEPSANEPYKGTVNTERWRAATSAFLLKESGIVVDWVSEAPTIEVTKDHEETNSWNMVGIDLWNDQRAQPLGYGDQSPMAVMSIFMHTSNTDWTKKLLSLPEEF